MCTFVLNDNESYIQIHKVHAMYLLLFVQNYII